jgi:hypothetical protein
VENKHGINVGAQAVRNEKDVAQKRESSKCHDCSHAKTCENTECGEEPQEVDPCHSLISVFGLSAERRRKSAGPVTVPVTEFLCAAALVNAPGRSATLANPISSEITAP